MCFSSLLKEQYTKPRVYYGDRNDPPPSNRDSLTATEQGSNGHASLSNSCVDLMPSTVIGCTGSLHLANVAAVMNDARGELLIDNMSAPCADDVSCASNTRKASEPRNGDIDKGVREHHALIMPDIDSDGTASHLASSNIGSSSTVTMPSGQQQCDDNCSGENKGTLYDRWRYITC